MSHYTTQLRYICEGIVGCNESVGVNEIDDVINKSTPEIFDFATRNKVAGQRDFQHRFLMRYWDREICCETYGMWKLYLRQALDKDAERWNALLDSTKEKYRIFDNVQITKEGNTNKYVDSASTNNNSQNTQSKSNNTNANKYSDTPQGQLSNVEDGKYLTSYTFVKDSNELSNFSNSTGSSDYAEENRGNYRETTTGRVGGKTNTEIMVEYRKALFDIEEQLIASLEGLFFGLW